MSSVALASPSSKKPKLSENGGVTSRSKELTKGAKWMIDQIDQMQAAYRLSLMAAVAIIQYQTQARKLGQESVDIPRQLQRRLDGSWAKYEAIKRHVEWYTAQNALFASSPNHPAIILPTPQSQAMPSLPVMPQLTAATPDQPKASPIPLSSASLLAFDPSNPAGLNAPASATAKIGPLPVSNPLPVEMSGLDAFQTNAMAFPQDTSGNNNSMDLTGLNLDDLSAIVNGNSDFFGASSSASMSVPHGQQPPTDMAAMLRAAGFDPTTQSSDTDNLLASLNSTLQVPQAQSQIQSGSGDLNLDFLATSNTQGQNQVNNLGQMGGGGQTDSMGGQPDFTFDYSGGGLSDLDLSSLTGLFDTGSSGNNTSQVTPIPPVAQLSQPAAESAPAAPETASAPLIQSQVVPTAATVPASSTQKPSQGIQESDFLAPSDEQSTGTNVPPPPPQVTTVQQPTQSTDINMDMFAMSDMVPSNNAANPSGDGTFNLDLGQGTETYDGANINVDDFDFGDNSIPNVEGEEFDQWFSEFK